MTYQVGMTYKTRNGDKAVILGHVTNDPTILVGYIRRDEITIVPGMWASYDGNWFTSQHMTRDDCLAPFDPMAEVWIKISGNRREATAALDIVRAAGLFTKASVAALRSMFPITLPTDVDARLLVDYLRKNVLK